METTSQTSPKSPSTEEAKNFVPAMSRAEHKDAVAITILREPQEVYTFWRNLKNLCLFMKDIEDVHILSENRSKWFLRTQTGLEFEWTAQIVGDIPGRWLAWRSEEGSRLQTAGAVSFEEAPRNRGTIVRLSLSYKIPGGKAAELAAFFTGEDPRTLTMTNLKRMKAFLETGEIPTTEGQPTGRDDDAETLPDEEIHELKH